jgi:predicted TIM-barrel fold metal-dependent hydrolase
MLDHQCNEMRTHEEHGLKLRPKEYFQRNFWASFWFEKNAIAVNLDEIGMDRILFETDYPHPTSLFPGVQEWLADSVGHLPYEARKQILQTNAGTLYNLDL